jgi:aromatic ring-opening dioxygenase LigB subunit
MDDDTTTVRLPREFVMAMRVGAKLGAESIEQFAAHLVPAVREITRRRAAILGADRRVTLTGGRSRRKSS